MVLQEDKPLLPGRGDREPPAAKGLDAQHLASLTEAPNPTAVRAATSKSVAVAS